MVRKDEMSDKLATESRLTKVETNVNTIMTNHLPHLDAKVDDLALQITRVKDELRDEIVDLKIVIARWGGAIMVITAAANLLLKYMK